jgi:hypothetical protein
MLQLCTTKLSHASPLYHTTHQCFTFVPHISLMLNHSTTHLSECCSFVQHNLAMLHLTVVLHNSAMLQLCTTKLSHASPLYHTTHQCFTFVPNISVMLNLSTTQLSECCSSVQHNLAMLHLTVILHNSAMLKLCTT